jgi:acetyl-CoA carboxylase, biotin carboxylase subunit
LPTRGRQCSRGALDEFRISPIKTTIPLHRRIMDHPQFLDATFDIHYIERMLKAEAEPAAALAETRG